MKGKKRFPTLFDTNWIDIYFVFSGKKKKKLQKISRYVFIVILFYLSLFLFNPICVYVLFFSLLTITTLYSLGAAFFFSSSFSFAAVARARIHQEGFISTTRPHTYRICIAPSHHYMLSVFMCKKNTAIRQTARRTRVMRRRANVTQIIIQCTLHRDDNEWKRTTWNMPFLVREISLRRSLSLFFLSQ